MRHPTDRVLRRLLDEPGGVPDADRHHVAGCPRCLTVLSDAGLPGDTSAAPAPDRSPAGPRSSAASRTTGAGSATSLRARLSRALRRPAVAALAVGVVLTGAGTAAANNWLEIFRTEQVAPVSLTAADLVALPDLSRYGDVDVTGDGELHEVADAAAAAARTGLDAPEVAALPAGVTGEPVHQVAGEVQVAFTFSADRAAQAATDAGSTLPAPPPGLDGSELRLVAGPGAAQVWRSAAGSSALVVGRAVAPTAFSSGVPFETARDYVLSLPGVPDDVAAQLRAFTADGSTLPMPVPADRVTTRSTQVGGVPATVLEAHDRTMAAVVWVEQGVVTAVAGALDADEVVSVARDLR